jgi:hypothetical protein
MQAATIKQSDAESLARRIRDDAARYLNRGVYSDFLQGLAEGQIITIECWMEPRDWVIQGIKNEVEFYRHEADRRQHASN